MATTELLLLKPVESLGHEGEQITVKAGYARNYLLPRGIAVHVTRSNKKQIEALQARREARLSRELDGAQRLGERIETISLAISVKTGPGGKLFGSVTALDLQSRLAEQGVELDRKQIQLNAPIKTLGQHTTTLKLHPEVSIDFSFEVVSENPVEEIEGAQAEDSKD